MLFGTNQRKPMGLFGGFAPSGGQQAPQDDPMGGAGLGMQQATQQASPQMMGQGAQQFSQEQAPKKPGVNWWGVLADALAGAAGREGPYAASMRARQEQEAAQEHARQQREASMQDGRAKFLFEQQYKRENPEPHQPDDFERSLIGGGILPGTPEWAEANRQRSQNFTDPIVNVQTPTGYYSGPRSGLAAAMQGGAQQPVGGLTPVGKLKPLGGVSGQPAGGGFPGY